jgi:hypothetical protein
MDTVNNVVRGPVAYFAHAVSHYGTYVEGRCIDLIESHLSNGNMQSAYGDFYLVNPNNQLFQNIYNNRKANDHPDRFSFFTEVVGGCDVIFGSTFLDGCFGMGVAAEMKTGLTLEKEVFVIDLSIRYWPITLIPSVTTFEKKYGHRFLDYEQTVKRIHEKIL